VYKLVFFVPVDAAESVKDAVFEAGGGMIGDYDKCSWQTLGQGQFRPLSGSNPAIGALNELEYVEEYRVELVVDGELINEVVGALKLAHPYEEPAYDVVRLEVF